MASTGLIPFWIKSPNQHAPMGFGVTARSLADALHIIRGCGWAAYLPEDEGELRVIANVRVADLDQRHVVPNMGPIVVRGLWFPFRGVGVPEWMAE